MAIREESWGRYPKVLGQANASPRTPNEVRTVLAGNGRPLLPRGLGRSYGDSCLVSDGTLLHTTRLDRFCSFDAQTGLLCCEAGVSFAEILNVFVPRGWFPPVTPGTKFVTVGGAIANDVHGKNHHIAGSFGNHVVELELQRSDGTVHLCSRDQNADWFAATIGGLGLTGVILRVTLKLRRIESAWIDAETIRFGKLEEFFALSEESAADYEYTVAWIDATATGDKFGRGLFIRGNHAAVSSKPPFQRHRGAGWKRMPFDAPGFVLSRPTVSLFNSIYFHRQRGERQKSVVHYDPFFYPLDVVEDWNRIYGKRGFLQWQCVVPPAAAPETTEALLREIAASGRSSFLSVLKEFGQVPADGLLSFPREGVTLALDFANTGRPLFELLDRLDALVLRAGGALYPAKDARMSPELFRASFPRLQEFLKFVDPAIDSDFMRRVSVAGEGGP